MFLLLKGVFMNVYKNIAKFFKNKMQKEGLTIKQVSQLSGLSVKTISNILKAKKVNYRVRTLILMLDFLEVKCKNLIGV